MSGIVRRDRETNLTCPCCGKDPKETYRCQHCGKDLTDHDRGTGQ